MRAIKQAKKNQKKRTVFGALFCLALSIGAAHAVAPAATPTQQQISSYEHMDETARVRLLIRLAKSGYHELAFTLLQRYPLHDAYAANRSLFIKGLIERGRGNLKSAAALYRDALADDPSLSLVRSELAQTLAEMGEDDSAKHQLNRLLADATTDDEAQGIRAFIDRIDANRPFAFSSYVSVVPSTNINAGSDNKRVFDPSGNLLEFCTLAGDGFSCQPDGIGVIQDARKSGVGLSAGGSVGFTHQLDSSFAFVAGAGMDGRIYKDSAYSSLGISESLELRYLTQDGFFGVGAIGSQGLRTNEIGVSYYSYGPRVSYQKQISSTDRLNLSVVHEWRRFPSSKTYNGYTTSVDAAWNHSFRADMGITLTAAFENLQTGLDYNSYQAYSAGLTLYKELPKGVTLSLQGEYRYAHFNDIFDEGDTPEYDFVRQDHQVAAGASLTKRDWNIFGYAPSLRYSYAHNFSNVDIHAFDSHTVDFSLTKDF